MPVPGQRLSFFADAWRKAGADPDLLNLVRDGHRIIFDDGPPPCTLPSQEYETRLPEAKMEVIRGEIDNLLRKGAVRSVLDWANNYGTRSTKFCHAKSFISL